MSHHLIVYKDDMDTVEQTTPMPCQPFTGALNTTGAIEPIVITQKHDDEISLPDGVAYTLDAHQMIKLEMHYINATDSDQQGQATVDLFAADPATIHDEAGLMFAGSLDIDILPNQQFTLHQFLTLPAAFNLSSSHIWAMTGHEHKLGTGVTINVAPSRDGPMTSEYAPNPFLWAEPVTTTYDPDFSIPQSGGFDFHVHCTRTRPTPRSSSANRRTTRCASSGSTTGRRKARRSARTRSRSAASTATTSAVPAIRTAR